MSDEYIGDFPAEDVMRSFMCMVVDNGPRVRTRFNYNRDMMSQATGLICDLESQTKQSFVEECDINTIVRKFGLTGQLPDNVAMPTYGDYEGVFDFQTAMNTMMAAEKSFMALPADIRAKFENDPQNLLEFCSHEANRDEAVKWGLVPPPPAPPAEPPAAPPAPAQTSSST